MSLDLNDIWECHGYPTELYRSRSCQNVRRVSVPWASRYEWADWFVDNDTYPYTLAEAGFISGFVSAIGIEGDKNTAMTHGAAHVSQAQYERAILTVEYSASSRAASGSVMIQEIMERTEMAYVAGDGFTWSDETPLPEDMRLSAYVSGFVLRTTYPRLLSTPSNIVSLQGYVNSEVFTPTMFPSISIARGCLLCNSAACSGVLSTNGSVRFRASYSLLSRAADWNKEYNPNSGVCEYVYHSGSPLIRYPYRIFTGTV